MQKVGNENNVCSLQKSVVSTKSNYIKKLNENAKSIINK